MTRALEAAPTLVASVDSLSTRRMFTASAHGLELGPLFAAAPLDDAAVRRLRARVAADPALRSLVAPNERGALLLARLRPAAPAAPVAALVAELRQRFHDPPEFSLAAACDAASALALARDARGDLGRAAALALAALAFWVALVAGVRLGVAVAALAALAGMLGAGALAAAGAAPGSGAAFLPVLVCTAAAGASFALLARMRAEERAGGAVADALGRALAGAGPPLAAAALAGAAGFAALGWLAPSARGLALGALCAELAAAGLVALGLPAFALVFALPTGRAGGVARWLESALARLDVALRTRGTRRALGLGAALLIAAWAGFGLGALRAESDPAALLPEGAPERDGPAQIARDFGGGARVELVLDSGAPGGAAEPLFLERALELERALAAESGVGFTRSLLDALILPATRAAHDGDPGFAVVPPTRAQVEDELDAAARDAPDLLAGAIDAERRRLSVDALVDVRDPARLAALAQRFAAHAPELARASAARDRAAALALAALAAVAAAGLVGAAAFASPLAGALAALPPACAALAVLGLLGRLELPLDGSSSAAAVLAAAAATTPALLYLSRARELCAAGAELGVAASLALRDVGLPIAEAALAGGACLALLAASPPLVRWSGLLACLGVGVGAAAALALLPLALRALRPAFLGGRIRSGAEETLSCVRGAGREKGL